MSGADAPGAQPRYPTQDRHASTTPDSIVHASCVAIEARGALILGASGRGKTSLALGMMALGAGLVADDRVCLTRRGGSIIASAPAPLRGLIEARGIGLLHAEPHAPVALACVIDLDQDEPDRMPPLRHIRLLGQSVTLLLRVDTPHFPAGLVQYLKAGRHEA